MTTHRLALCLLLFLSFLQKSFATHIVGGEITYKCLGHNNFEITLTVYRDCFNGNPKFDDPDAKPPGNTKFVYGFDGKVVGIQQINQDFGNLATLNKPNIEKKDPTLSQLLRDLPKNTRFVHNDEGKITGIKFDEHKKVDPIGQNVNKNYI